MKKFSIMQKENTLLISIIENGNIILDELSENDENLDNYKYIGLLFNSIGKLNKNKPMKIIFNLKKLPFIFILLILKIKANTNIDIRLVITDSTTYDFIQEFINADPNETRNFFTKTTANLKDNKYNFSEDDADKEVKGVCEENIKNKFKNLKAELDKNQEQLKRKGFLDDVDLEANPEIKKDNEKIERYLEIIKNASSDNFIDNIENNFINELKKIQIDLITSSYL